MVRATVVETKRVASIDDDEDYETEEDQDPDEIELADDLDADDLTIQPFRPEDESLSERIAALKDIIPPKTRATLHGYYSTLESYATFGGKIAGRVAWIGMTSALLVGLPLALSIENEGMILQQEKDYYAQTSGQQGAVISGQPAQGGSGQPTGIVPPGF